MHVAPLPCGAFGASARWNLCRRDEALDGSTRKFAPHRALVDFIAAQDWGPVDTDTRTIAVFEINRAITARRERQTLPPINDALPGEPLTAFQIIREIINQFPAHAGRPAGVSGKQWNDENVKQNDQEAGRV